MANTGKSLGSNCSNHLDVAEKFFTAKNCLETQGKEQPWNAPALGLQRVWQFLLAQTIVSKSLKSSSGLHPRTVSRCFKCKSGCLFCSFLV